MTDIYELFMPIDNEDVFEKLYITTHYAKRLKERYTHTIRKDGSDEGVTRGIRKFVKSFMKGKAKGLPGKDGYFIMDQHRYKHIFYWKYGYLWLVTVYDPSHPNYNLKNKLVLDSYGE